MEEAKADDVAVFAGGARHEREGILAERAAEAVEETLFGAGRVEGGSKSGHGEMVCEGGEKEKWESGRKWPFEAQGKRVASGWKRREIPHSADSVRNDDDWRARLTRNLNPHPLTTKGAAPME